MKMIIDRFEGDFAVVELNEGQTVNMPRILLPDAKEGDTVTIEISRDNNRRQRIDSLVGELFK